MSFFGFPSRTPISDTVREAGVPPGVYRTEIVNGEVIDYRLFPDGTFREVCRCINPSEATLADARARMARAA